jgi:RNA polymerase sigma-70 factor (ECF subfamily)
MNSTPASLLQRLRSPGEDAAWERFVKLYTPFIFFLGRRSGLSRDDAAELVQDVFVILAQKMPEFAYDRTKRFRAWLRTVTSNKLREKARRRRVAATSDDEVLASLADPAACNSFEEGEYRRQVATRALELMQSEFEPSTWQACWEHVVSGRPAAEVGAALGMSEGAVYVAKCRVLKRLREELQGLLD